MQKEKIINLWKSVGWNTLNDYHSYLKSTEEFKKAREKWNKTEATWEWQLATFISNCRWKVQRFFNPFNRKLDTIEKNLRDKAKAQTELP